MPVALPGQALPLSMAWRRELRVGASSPLSRRARGRRNFKLGLEIVAAIKATYPELPTNGVEIHKALLQPLNNQEHKKITFGDCGQR